jgi:dTDP-4-dehydrorhamnose reductase
VYDDENLTNVLQMNLTKDTKVMILGCGGMLGQAVYERFSKSCTVLATDIDLNSPWLEHLDVRDWQQLYERARQFKPDLLINLAALTDLEYCELHSDNAYLTNGLGQENACLAALKLDIPLVYVSTAGIFDGAAELYNDFDKPNPLSIYGKSKYYGEQVTQQMWPKAFIFRAGWMMGGGAIKDKKFINKIFKQITGGATTLHVVDDKLGTPTYTVDFAGSMFRIVESGFYGLYNMVCSGSASRYDVAVEFLRCLGLEKRIEVKIVNSDFFKKTYFAPRPYSEKLVNLKLISRKMMHMRDWKICLNEYAEVFKAQLKSK